MKPATKTTPIPRIPEKDRVTFEDFLSPVTVRFISLLASIATSCWIVSSKVNTIDRRLDAMVTIAAFSQWEQALIEANKGIGLVVPRIILFQRVSMNGTTQVVATVGDKIIVNY